MTLEALRTFCLRHQGVTESFPFDEDTLVFKVMGKMFALVSLEEKRISLKCDPEKAISLREHHPAVTPGYHMNKHYWNTILLDGTIPEKLLQEWIDDSYRLVVEGLPKKVRDSLSNK
jgi:predicted DNA-binding protein (MmcQ/YjbR family)